MIAQRTALFDPPDPPPNLHVYAVNLSDLTALAQDNPFTTQILLADFMDQASPHIVTNKNRFDENAIIIDGPASYDRERLEAFITLLMCIIGPRKLKRPIRCYRQGPKGGWRRIPRNERTIEE